MKLSDDVLKLPNIFCINELEAEGTTGIAIKDMKDVKKSIEKLKSKGCQTVIITLGKNGAAFNDETNNIVLVPLPSEVNVIDTVGAGDAFIGALAFFIAKYPEASLIQKVGSSIAIASHSVQFKGTQTSFINFPSFDPTTKTYHFKEL